jgi:AAA15 family ATPase/GTPase
MGDTSTHLSFFKVENFKRFKSFELNDLGQFNLIVGDNNIGKTSVLEALLFNKDSLHFVNNLFNALKFRKIKNSFVYGDIEFYVNKKNTEGGRIHHILFQYRYQNSDKTETIDIEINKDKRLLLFHKKPIIDNDREFSLGEGVSMYGDLNLPFIPFYKGHDEDLTNFYPTLQESRTLKMNFINSLKVIIPEIIDIEPSSRKDSNQLLIYQSNIDSSIPLALFGDGALKLFRLLAEIAINKGRRLMIDEIDTGIHYSRFKEFWRIVLLTAKQNDVQLFMTTHNEECIKYFVEVLQESGLSDLQPKAKAIALVGLKDMSVKAYTYPFDHLEANLTVGNDVRGGAK